MATAAYGPATMFGGRRKSFEAEDGAQLNSPYALARSARHTRYRSALPVIDDNSPILSGSHDRFSRSDGLTNMSTAKKVYSLPRANSDSSFAQVCRTPIIAEVKRNHSLKVKSI